jgi:hypothetical protein
VALPSVIDETVEVRSKALFGNRHMLRIAGDIAGRTSRFTVQGVANQTQVPYSSAHRLVRQLESLGLVEVAPAGSPENHRWYTRATHTFWDAAQQLCVVEGNTPKGRTRKRRQTNA